MNAIKLILLMAVVTVGAHAQKLPNVQTKSKRTPNGLKIDGKATEWGGFEAYNNTTNVWYTTANDDKNLYLALRCDDANTLSKITNNGIKLFINATGKKDDQQAVMLNYPAFQPKNKPSI